MTEQEFEQSRQSWREREESRQARTEGWLAWLDDNAHAHGWIAS